MKATRLLGIVALIGCAIALGFGSGLTGPQASQAKSLRAMTSANCAQYVSEGPPYDYATVPAWSTFTKWWRLRNCGTNTWTTSYWVWKDSGNTCYGSFHPTIDTPPGSTGTFYATCSVGAAKQYFANYYMATPGGTKFGDRFWVIVNAR